MKRGKLIVIDGLDGIGKGVFLDALIEEAKKDGKKVFDAHEFWSKKNNKHPFLTKLFGLNLPTLNHHPDIKKIIGKFDIIVTSEPTFVGIGKTIRKELISKNGRTYSPEAVAQAYALDRFILYQQLILPALKAGLDVYQSRSFSTSIVYQRQSALDLGREFSMGEILSISGNKFCYKHPMDFLIVPTIKNVKEAIRRASERKKDDNCKFENLQFQLKIKKQYESKEFRKIFTKVGTKVVYMDAGKTIGFSKQQAKDFYQQKLK